MNKYKIQEISKHLELPASTIRFWETEFSGFIDPIRTNGGQRRYSQNDINYLTKIKELLHARKMTITQAKLFLKNDAFDQDENSISNKSILITGGTGFIGKHLCNYLLTKCNPQVIRIFSRDETKQHEMKKKFGEDIIRYFIGDIRDAYRLKRAMEGVDIVIHAAALKQIPSCDFNPFEAVKTNVQGVENIIDAAIDVGVQKVLTLSTGEAVNPVNLYGATRLCAEKILTRGSAYSGSRSTKFSCVRLGNIIGSPGNMMAALEDQRKTGKITIADPSMTSFWTTVEQSLEHIINSLSLMQGGEIFVANTSSAKNLNIVKAIAPECAIKIAGLTSGDKRHEILITEEEGRNTVIHKNAYVILPNNGNCNKSNLGDSQPVSEGFIYSSAHNDKWITAEEIRQSLYGFSIPENNFSSVSWNVENTSRI
ncbi:MAG: polysaccharide biosynthesis protein [Smithellaceae bacterium]